MRVKRYVVDSMPDALQKIRTDLGKDAVILNTKEIRSGGFLGLFGKKKIEVIAATDANTNSNSDLTGKSAAGQAPNPSFARTAMTKPATASVPTSREHRSDFPEVPDVLAAHVSMTKEAVTVPAEDKISPTVYSAYSPTSVASAQAAVKPKEEVLLEELRQMKDMMRKMTISSSQEEPLPESLQKLQSRLLDQEVDPELINQMIENTILQFEGNGEPISDEAALQSFRSQLIQLLQTGSNKSIASSTRVVHFVGPTGVGKTTTIAKLAAEQVLKYNRKVGFITSDTYRIAAIEQLKTYATILNVPIEVVFSPQDLNRAFHNLEACDVIFMDTAGRNFRNEMYVSELNALLRTQGNSETILVLSLTTKYKDMKAITTNFNKFKLDKVLFTKMDETDSYGAIVNLVHDFSLQLSYVTNGQSVPDDISELDEPFIADLLLEEPKS